MKKLLPILTFFLLFQVDFTYLSAQEEIVQYGKMVSSNRIQWENFGNSVDICENYMLIGDAKDKFDENGENWIDYAGGAYLYQLHPSGSYEYITKLMDPERKPGKFGTSVSITDNFALIGAGVFPVYLNDYEYDGAGAAFLFSRDSDNNWNFLERILCPQTVRTSWFGSQVMIKDSLLIISANYIQKEYGRGSVYIYKITPDNSIEFIQELSASNEYDNGQFGDELAADNNRLIVYSSNASSFSEGIFHNREGILYCYELQNDTFAEVQQLFPEESSFWYDIDIQNDELVIGVPGSDTDELGENEMENAGAVYIYKPDPVSGLWEKSSKKVASIRAAFAHFGKSVSIHNNYIAVGAIGETTNTENEAFLSRCRSRIFIQERSGSGLDRKL